MSKEDILVEERTNGRLTKITEEHLGELLSNENHIDAIAVMKLFKRAISEAYKLGRKSRRVK